MGDRERGTVKWFDGERGYGFVERAVGDDVFVHMTDVKRAGLESLFEGQHLTFEVESSGKGPQAVGLQPVDVQGRRAPELGPPPSDPVNLEQVFYAAAMHMCELEGADASAIEFWGDSNLASVDPKWRIDMDIIGPYDGESATEFFERKLEILGKLAEVAGTTTASKAVFAALRALRGLPTD